MQGLRFVPVKCVLLLTCVLETRYSTGEPAATARFRKLARSAEDSDADLIGDKAEVGW